MNLAYKFPIIYWNTACLLVDSGGEDGNTDYTKIAQSVNRIRQAGINILLVDINKSSLSFEPDEENNRILFGLKALTNINEDFVKEIERGRPYVSVIDFVNKVKPKKPAMISLIKGGAFDQLVDRRERAMVEYIWLTCDKKKRLTLQNLPSLIKLNIIPDEEKFTLPRRVFEFNRYLKNESNCQYNSIFFHLTPRAIDFLEKIEHTELIEFIDNNYFMSKKKWDKVYQLYMDIFREWIASDKDNILKSLNTEIFMQDWLKYTQGNISTWEMEALCFYYHEHELAKVNTTKYGLADFSKLSEQPIVEKTFKKGSSLIPIYRLFIICGTCIAKNKDKSTVYLLTTSGVVPVKFTKEYFSLFDKQISKKNSDGTKTVIERSWFNRGKMIMVKGIRRGNEFIAKNYKSSGGHRLYKIERVLTNGDLILSSERAQGEVEDDI